MRAFPLQQTHSSTKLTLVYANTEERDILQRDTLEAWAADSADQLTLVLVLSSPPDGWSGLSGRIDRPKLEAVEDVAAGPSDDVLVCVCGPPAMYDSIYGARGQDEELGILGELGLTKESIFKF